MCVWYTERTLYLVERTGKRRRAVFTTWNDLGFVCGLLFGLVAISSDEEEATVRGGGTEKVGGGEERLR